MAKVPPPQFPADGSSDLVSDYSATGLAIKIDIVTLLEKQTSLREERAAVDEELALVDDSLMRLNRAYLDLTGLPIPPKKEKEPVV